jgi:diguanylate cyclase (GGDEF)-like protein
MKPLYRIALTGIIFSLFYFYLCANSANSIFLRRMSIGTQDMLFKIRRSTEGTAKNRNDITIVSIDNESCDRLGLRWPWPRKTFAALVQRLSEEGAGAIALNFSFTGAENEGQEGIEAMAEAMRQARVVVGATMDRQKLIKPDPILLNANVRYGYLEKIIDDDYAIRRSFPFRSPLKGVGAGSSSIASFPLEVARLTKNFHEDQIILRPDGSYDINYLMRQNDFSRVSAWKILQRRALDVPIRGKVVFVGATSELFSDRHATPLGLMPGVMVHANEYIAMTSKRYLQFWPMPLLAGFFWLLSLFLLFLILSRRIWLGLLCAALVIFAVFLISQILLTHDIVIPSFLLLLAPALALITGSVAQFLFLFLENRGLEKKVTLDKMTGLYTYDYLRLRLDDEWKRCQKLALPISIAMTDLDRFKTINDTLGHETGNHMILRTASVLRESARGYDVVARYGGDEFVILLWHANHVEAKAYRDRLRKQYEAMAATLTEPLLQASSISIGIASFDPKENKDNFKNTQELVEAADQDLFRDKQSRRKPGESSR